MSRIWITKPEIAMIALCVAILASLSDHPILAVIIGLLWVSPMYMVKPKRMTIDYISGHDKRYIRAFLLIFSIYRHTDLHIHLHG